MPSNIIIFEADYVTELVSSMNSACELMSEAVQSLKQASLHEGWKCKECANITENLDDLNLRLGRLDEGVNETSRVLGGSVSRFTSLEASYRNQAEGLSEDLTQKHGYSGTVITDPSESANSSGNAGNTASGGKAGASKSSAGSQSGSNSESNRTGNNTGSASGGRASSMASSAGGAGVIISGNKASAGTSESESSLTGSGALSGYSSVSMNLPVTHIPDRPEVAAKGIKYTQEITDAAVSSVAESITEVLNSSPVRLSSATGAGMAARNLIEAYNAGKSIVENSASIMSNPSMPHTKERLAMAEGIASLAGTSAFMTSGNTSSGTSGFNAVHTENVRSNAGNLISAVQDVNGGGELKNVLTSVMSDNSEGISPFTVSGNSTGSTFFDKIVDAIKKTLLEGGKSSSGSANSSSPIDEFMKNLITEQV